MAKKTNAEILIAYLTLMGNKQIPRRSSRYTVFENRKRQGSFYYVGKNGALRIGPNIESSASCTERISMSGIRKWVEERESDPEMGRRTRIGSGNG